MHIRGITLSPEGAPAALSDAAPPPGKSATAMAATATTTPTTPPRAAPGVCFEIDLGGGRAIAVRVETASQRALWVRELLRLASWRAVHLLQLELAAQTSAEWQPVDVADPRRAPREAPPSSQPREP